MLEINNLSFGVPDSEGTLEIIEDVSLTVNDGEFLVITGPNGGGKSTLAKLIMGIEKPTGGSIILDGVDVTDFDITQRANMGIGYAFQQPPRFKGLTVRQLLSLANGSDLPEDECCAYLRNVGLCSKEYLNREVDSSLSGGELKRIEIATLLARDLKLALFDEPEAGIDLWSFSALVETFRSFSRKKHKSVVIISHQERIMQLADRIAVISDGKLTGVGGKDIMFRELMCELDATCDFGGGKSNA